MNNRFENFTKGLTKLTSFVGELEFCPVPASFPNGAPDHSRGAYCAIRTKQVEMWDHLDDYPEFEKEMRDLGWRPESDFAFWVYE